MINLGYVSHGKRFSVKVANMDTAINFALQEVKFGSDVKIYENNSLAAMISPKCDLIKFNAESELPFLYNRVTLIVCI